MIQQRMLLFVGVVAALTLHVSVTAEEARNVPPGCFIHGVTGELICKGQQTDVIITPTAPTTSYPFRELWESFLSSDEDGSTCIETHTVRLGREPTQDEDIQAEMQFFRFLRSYDLCPTAILPDTTPEFEALAFVRTIPFPTPEPYVAPGTLPVGLEAYLETGAATTDTFGPEPTPFGDLVVTATADVYVDWDDPYDDVDGEHGPYEGAPGAHPDGEITHLYQYDGRYEITVRYVWTVDWAIGDVTGTIPGIETSGTYPAPGFEVYSRQAVG